MKDKEEALLDFADEERDKVYLLDDERNYSIRSVDNRES